MYFAFKLNKLSEAYSLVRKYITYTLKEALKADSLLSEPPGKPGVSAYKLKGILKKFEVKSLSHIRLFETPWTVAHQAPLSMEFFM